MRLSTATVVNVQLDYSSRSVDAAVRGGTGSWAFMQQIRTVLHPYFMFTFSIVANCLFWYFLISLFVHKKKKSECDPFFFFFFLKVCTLILANFQGYSIGKSR